MSEREPWLLERTFAWLNADCVRMFETIDVGHPKCPVQVVDLSGLRCADNAVRISRTIHMTPAQCAARYGVTP